MNSFLDAKSMAKYLRQFLATKGCDISHGESLELVAKQFGLPSWNVLAARIDQARAINEELDIPSGWRLTKFTNWELYRVGIDKDVANTVLIESRYPHGCGIDLSTEYPGLQQSIDALPYRGKRLRLSAELMSESVDKGVIWLRVDTAPGGVSAFDNMMSRSGSNGALKGTHSWCRRHVVLDVDEYAKSIHFGALMQGYGCLRVRNMRLEVVGNEVSVTSGWGNWLSGPTNLEFSGTM